MEPVNKYRAWTEDEIDTMIEFVNSFPKRIQGIRTYAEQHGRTEVAVSGVYYTNYKSRAAKQKPETSTSKYTELENTVLDNLGLLFSYIRKLEQKNELLQAKLNTAESDLAEIGRIMALARKFAKEEIKAPKLEVRIGENSIVESVSESAATVES